MALHRLIDTDGSEIGIVEIDGDVVEGDTVELRDGTSTVVVEVYDDEDGREGGVASTLVVD